MTLSPRLRLALRVAGYVALGLVCFVYALHLTFPYHRVKDRMIESLSSKYEVTILDIERSLVPGRFSLEGVTLTSRPDVVGQPVTTMFFKRIEVDVAFLPLLSGKAEVGLDIATGGGSIAGSVRMAKTSLGVDFRLRRVPLATLPGVADAVGLPLGGQGDGRVSLTLPNNDWQRASGKVELSCKVGCTVGDGESRVYPKARNPNEALMVSSGIPVETITVTRFVLAMTIAKGDAFRDRFEFESPDGDLELDFDIKLAKKLGESTIAGCIRYRCSREYLSRSPAACELGSPAVDADGFRNIKLAGRLTAMRRLGQICDAGGNPDDVFSKDERVRVRPSLDEVAPAAAPRPTPTPPPLDTVKPPDMGRPPAADDVGGTPGAAVGTGHQPEPMPEAVQPPPVIEGRPPGDGRPRGDAPTIEMQPPAPGSPESGHGGSAIPPDSVGSERDRRTDRAGGAGGDDDDSPDR